MAQLVRKMGKSAVQTYPLGDGTHRIGRTDKNEIQVADPSVSSHHAEIVARPGPYLMGRNEYFIVDCDSRNGVIVNGDRKERHRLKHGDRIRIGNQKFEFVDEREDSGDRTVIKKPDR